MISLSEQGLAARICTNCSVAIMYPHENDELQGLGWFACGFCGFSKIIENEKYEHRSKNQK